MDKNVFIERVFELAFGDGALERDFSFDEVLVRLREFSDRSFEFDEFCSGSVVLLDVSFARSVLVSLRVGGDCGEADVLERLIDGVDNNGEKNGE